MNVLVACEESQTVCKAFREKGHNAYSCDIQDCSGGHPEWHILGDVLPLLNGCCTFQTMDGKTHYQGTRWDLLVAHPPCTKLSNAGAVNLGRKNCKCETREWREQFFNDRTDAAIFFMRMIAADCERIVVENPVGYMSTHYRPPDQYIEPYFFGDPFKKKTGLWIKNLPLLKPTLIVEPICKLVQMNKCGQKAKSESYAVVGTRDPKQRSRTFPGIAKAMADQWG